MYRPLMVSLVILLLTGCGQPSTLAVGDYDEAEMEAAIAKAQNTIGHFLIDLKKKNGTDFSVKVPVQDGDEIEHFWLTEIQYRNGTFTGKIGNEPGIVSNVQLGQPWTAKKKEISDWMFMRDGKMHGNFTLRPLLKVMSAAQAKQLQEILADDE